MRVSFVVRLDADQLAAGAFAGEVEAVATGAVAALRSVDDLVAFVSHRIEERGVAPTPGDRVTG